MLQWRMTESEEVSGRKRRSSAEIKRLVTEFQSSGLRQNEFCRNHGLALSSLQRQLKKRRRTKAKSRRAAACRSGTERQGAHWKGSVELGIEVVLSGGRRIEVRPVSIRTLWNDC